TQGTSTQRITAMCPRVWVDEVDRKTNRKTTMGIQPSCGDLWNVRYHCAPELNGRPERIRRPDRPNPLPRCRPWLRLLLTIHRNASRDSSIFQPYLIVYMITMPLHLRE